MAEEVRSTFHPNGDGTFTINRVQDVEDIIERNKALQNTLQSKKSDLRHVASIPMVILERWITEDGVNYMQLDGKEFARLIRRKLKDPDWAWLRTS